MSKNIADGTLVSWIKFLIDPSKTVPKYAFVYFTIPNDFKVNNDTLTGV